MGSDEELMERLIAGQNSALEELLRRYQGPLFSFAQRLVQSRSAAEDVFQETFLRVYRRRKSFHLGSPFRPWLYQICLNLCRDHHRRVTSRREVELCEENLGLDPAPGPQEKAEQAAQAREVQRAIAQLPQKQREVLILTQYEGLSQREVSEILNIPEGTVKSRKFKAIIALTKILSQKK